MLKALTWSKGSFVACSFMTARIFASMPARRTSSASIATIQSFEARSWAAFRALAKWNGTTGSETFTLAPISSAIATVRSVAPVSSNKISSQALALLRHRLMTFCSFLTIKTAEIFSILHRFLVTYTEYTIAYTLWTETLLRSAILKDSGFLAFTKTPGANGSSISRMIFRSHKIARISPCVYLHTSIGYGWYGKPGDLVVITRSPFGFTTSFN